VTANVVNLTIEKVVIIVAEFHYLFVVIFTTSFLQCKVGYLIQHTFFPSHGPSHKPSIVD